jgi:hypothetical protein
VARLCIDIASAQLEKMEEAEGVLLALLDLALGLALSSCAPSDVFAAGRSQVTACQSPSFAPPPPPHLKKQKQLVQRRSPRRTKRISPAENTQKIRNPIA